MGAMRHYGVIVQGADEIYFGTTDCQDLEMILHNLTLSANAGLTRRYARRSRKKVYQQERKHTLIYMPQRHGKPIIRSRSRTGSTRRVRTGFFQRDRWLTHIDLRKGEETQQPAQLQGLQGVCKWFMTRFETTDTYGAYFTKNL